MEWTSLLAYLREREGTTLRFLSQVDHDEDLLRILVGMANSYGGRVFIGMDQKNYHLVGTTHDADWVTSAISSNCHPEFSVGIEFIVKNDKHVMCITVPKSKELPVYFQDDCYVMEGVNARVASTDEITVLKSESKAVVTEDVPENLMVEQDMQIHVESRRDVQELSIDPLKSVSFDSRPIEEGSTIDIPVSKAGEAISVTGFLQEEITKQVVEPPAIPEAVMTDTAPVPDVISALQHSQRPNTVPEPVAQPELDMSASEEKIPEVALTDRQKKALDYLGGNPEFNRIKNKEYRALYNVSHKTAHIELVDLVSRGFLEVEGAGRSTCYKLLHGAIVRV